jgi:flavin-dependent dehydrogenase
MHTTIPLMRESSRTAELTADLSSRLWEVVVVGAGPAGAVAARELARQGMSVLLVDKSHFPRRKVCGGCLNAAALALLEQIGLGHLPRQLGAKPTRRLCLATGGRQAYLPLTGGAAISREAFDAALVEEAVAAGAKFVPGVTARIGLCCEGVRHVELSGPTTATTIHAQVVVAATGLSGLRIENEPQLSSAPSAKGRIGLGTVLANPPPAFRAETIYMAVGAGGYVGSVVLEDGRLDVAAALDPIALQRAGGPAAAAETIMREAGLCWPEGLAALPWQGTPTLTRRPKRVADERLFLIGDAAGYVEPITGEGMLWAILSACAVVPYVVAAAGAPSHEHAESWNRRHRQLLGRRMTVCSMVATLLRRPSWVRGAVGLLSWCPALARPLVRLSTASTSIRNSLIQVGH